MDEVLKNPDTTVDSGDRRRVKELCNELREKNISLSGIHSYSFAVSSIFNDFVNECDEFGGFVENVEQARRGGKDKFQSAAAAMA